MPIIVLILFMYWFINPHQKPMKQMSFLCIFYSWRDRYETELQGATHKSSWQNWAAKDLWAAWSKSGANLFFFILNNLKCIKKLWVLYKGAYSWIISEWVADVICHHTHIVHVHFLQTRTFCYPTTTQSSKEV